MKFVKYVKLKDVLFVPTFFICYFITSVIAAIYAYSKLSYSGITPLDLWLGIFFFTFFVFIIVYCISMVVYLWWIDSVRRL